LTIEIPFIVAHKVTGEIYVCVYDVNVSTQKISQEHGDFTSSMCMIAIT